MLLRSLSEMAVLLGLLSVHHDGQLVVVGLGTVPSEPQPVFGCF